MKKVYKNNIQAKILNSELHEYLGKLYSGFLNFDRQGVEAQDIINRAGYLLENLTGESKNTKTDAEMLCLIIVKLNFVFSQRGLCEKTVSFPNYPIFNKENFLKELDDFKKGFMGIFLGKSAIDIDTELVFNSTEISISKAGIPKTCLLCGNQEKEYLIYDSQWLDYLGSYSCSSCNARISVEIDDREKSIVRYIVPYDNHKELTLSLIDFYCLSKQEVEILNKYFDFNIYNYVSVLKNDTDGNTLLKSIVARLSFFLKRKQIILKQFPVNIGEIKHIPIDISEWKNLILSIKEHMKLNNIKKTADGKICQYNKSKTDKRDFDRNKLTENLRLNLNSIFNETADSHKSNQASSGKTPFNFQQNYKSFCEELNQQKYNISRADKLSVFIDSDRELAFLFNSFFFEYTEIINKKSNTQELRKIGNGNENISINKTLFIGLCLNSNLMFPYVSEEIINNVNTIFDTLFRNNASNYNRERNIYLNSTDTNICFNTCDKMNSKAISSMEFTKSYDDKSIFYLNKENAQVWIYNTAGTLKCYDIDGCETASLTCAPKSCRDFIVNNDGTFAFITSFEILLYTQDCKTLLNNIAAPERMELYYISQGPQIHSSAYLVTAVSWEDGKYGAPFPYLCEFYVNLKKTRTYKTQFNSLFHEMSNRCDLFSEQFLAFASGDVYRYSFFNKHNNESSYRKAVGFLPNINLVPKSVAAIIDETGKSHAMVVTGTSLFMGENNSYVSILDEKTMEYLMFTLLSYPGIERFKSHNTYPVGNGEFFVVGTAYLEKSNSYFSRKVVFLVHFDRAFRQKNTMFIDENFIFVKKIPQSTVMHTLTDSTLLNGILYLAVKGSVPDKKGNAKENIFFEKTLSINLQQ